MRRNPGFRNCICASTAGGAVVQWDDLRGMRCLGIDFGVKRLGLSYGDELGVATPLPALAGAAARAPVAALGPVIRERRITDLVVGHPLNMDGTAGFKAQEVERFASHLAAAFGLPVHLVDERLTTYEAEQATARAKRRAVRASGVIDSRAACLILQDFLNQRVAPPAPPGEP